MKKKKVMIKRKDGVRQHYWKNRAIFGRRQDEHAVARQGIEALDRQIAEQARQRQALADSIAIKEADKVARRQRERDNSFFAQVFKQEKENGKKTNTSSKKS